ncbi:MAG: hypothetical protein JO252_07180 [Planctomycetaceae bacterium]|nr:hypothetical protein [Planctomycetaceae bacterium]
MRPPHHILNRNRVHRLAAEHLQTHLQFKDYKRKTSAQMLWSLLLAAAARITSLSDACQRLRDAPSDETARKALWATLPDYAELQRRLNHNESTASGGETPTGSAVPGVDLRRPPSRKAPRDMRTAMSGGAESIPREGDPPGCGMRERPEPAAPR